MYLAGSSRWPRQGAAGASATYLRSLMESRVLGAQTLDLLLGRPLGSCKGLRFAFSACLLALELPLRSLRAPALRCSDSGIQNWDTQLQRSGTWQSGHGGEGTVR